MIDTAEEREKCRYPSAYPPWARNTVLRLLDALDAERARAEKAEAALQRVVDATWNEAVEACARAQEAAYVRGVFGEKHPDHIRALKRQETSHGA